MTDRYPGGFASVVLDCDSTLVSIEGIDELAGAHREQIRRMTDAAMEGLIPLEEVYGRRLDLISPSRLDVERIGVEYLNTLIPDVPEIVSALLHLGKTVRIISGGLRPPVEAVALAVGLTHDDVAAVGIDFDAEDRYVGYDRTSPLTRSGGKEQVIRRWDLPRPVVLVGDGATDLEARAAVDCFVAFMGVIYRPLVASEADIVLREPRLAPILALAASDVERERIRATRWSGVLAAGEALLAGAEPSGAQR